MSATDWEALRLEFIHGAMTAEELAERHGLKPDTVRTRARRGGWREQREELSRAVVSRAEAVAQAEESVAQHVDAVATAVAVEVKATTLVEFNADDVKLAKALRAEVAKLITEARKAGGARLSPRDLNALAATAERAQRMGRLALGVSTENVGLGGENGRGPVPVAAVTPAEYEAIARKLLEEF